MILIKFNVIFLTVRNINLNKIIQLKYKFITHMIKFEIFYRMFNCTRAIDRNRRQLWETYIKRQMKYHEKAEK